MVGVAQEKLKVEDVRWMLDNPHHVNFSKYPVEAAPPGGLYLKEIAYNPKGSSW